MPEIHSLARTLDGKPLSLDGAPKTLGDLLAVADEVCAGRGRIVTALRLDGAEEPAFRELHVVSRALSTIDVVDIESGTPSELALGCLAEAGQALRVLAGAAGELAAQVRAGDRRRVPADLAAIREGIATVLTITGAASLGVGIDLTTYTTDRGTLHDRAEQTLRDLEAIAAAQTAGNWMGLSDALKLKLARSLEGWSDVCASIDLAARTESQGAQA